MLAGNSNRYIPDLKVPYKHVQSSPQAPEKDRALNLEIFNPKGHKKGDKRPAIVFFFGGGWTGGNTRQFYQQSRFLTDRGMVAICAWYRVKTTPFDCVEDGKSAVRYIREHAAELGVDPDQIVASGGSAGGHVAACTGVIEGFDSENENLDITSVPNAMVLFNPVIDTTEKGYGLKKVGEDRKTDISPCHHVKKGIPPTLIIHGTNDRTVPFENVARFTKLMNAAGNTCTLMPFENAGHGFFNGSQFRKSSSDAMFDATMKQTVDFLTEQGILPVEAK